MFHQTSILAIALKSKRLGAAVFFGERLIYYQSSSLILSGKNRLSAAKKITDQLIQRFAPRYLALEEITNIRQKNQAMKNLRRMVVKTSERRTLFVKSYSLNEIRAAFCPDKKPTRKKVAKVLVTHYPELKKFVERQSPWQLDYAQLIFSAVATGLVCARDISPAKRNSA